MPRRLPAIRSRLAAAVLVTSVGLGLVACAPSAEPAPTAPVTPEPTSTEAVEAPAFHPDGTAEENLPIFAAVADQVWASDQRASGRAYIDALVEVGFDKSAMQVTDDLSTVGNAAESMQFSVRWGDDACLVGQVGPSTGEPVTMVMQQLAEGRCLIGSTRPIDW